MCLVYPIGFTLFYFVLLVSFKDEITTRTGVCVSCKIGVDDELQQPLFLYERHGKSEDGIKVGSLCPLCYERMEKVSHSVSHSWYSFERSTDAIFVHSFTYTQEHYLFMIKSEIKREIETQIEELQKKIDSLEPRAASTQNKVYSLLFENISCSGLHDTGNEADPQDPSLAIEIGVPQTYDGDYSKPISKSTRRMKDMRTECELFTEVIYKCNHVTLKTKQ